MKRIGSIAAVVIALTLSAWPAHAQITDSVPLVSQSAIAPFRIFHTSNINSLLELDTSNGHIWQLQ